MWKASIVSSTTADTQIINCYNYSNTTISFCGQNHGTIVNSYNINSKIASYNAGTITNCYYLAGNDANATKKTEEQMKTSDFLTLLNTLTTTTTTTDPETGDEVTTTTTTTQSAWVADTIGINEGFPILSWQAEEND